MRMDFHRVALLDGVDDVLSFEYGTEYAVLSVEPGRCDMGDEELGAVGIRTGICHRQFARPVVGECQCARFVIEGIARAARSLSIRTSALDHEVGDDAMEDEVVIEACLCELDEVLGGLGCLFGKELDLDGALAGRNSRCRHLVLRAVSGNI